MNSTRQLLAAMYDLVKRSRVEKSKGLAIMDKGRPDCVCTEFIVD